MLEPQEPVVWSFEYTALFILLVYGLYRMWKHSEAKSEK